MFFKAFNFFFNQMKVKDSNRKEKKKKQVI